MQIVRVVNAKAIKDSKTLGTIYKLSNLVIQSGQFPSRERDGNHSRGEEGVEEVFHVKGISLLHGEVCHQTFYLILPVYIGCRMSRQKHVDFNIVPGIHVLFAFPSPGALLHAICECLVHSEFVALHLERGDGSNGPPGKRDVYDFSAPR